MSFETFIHKTFRQSSEIIIAQANAIIDEYQDQGYVLTLRQLYYQFVARDLIANTMRQYKRLVAILSDARLAGLVPWDALEDRTRNLKSFGHWDSAEDMLLSCAHGFRLDKWADQDHRVEVWIEKEALVSVIERVCAIHDVPYFACRGYVSQSEQWRAGKRLQGYREGGQTPVVLHLGDHDPSGIDMTRDNADRLAMFARMGVEVRRLALNMDQIDEYAPPPNPAKMTDSRFGDYAMQFGNESWELDALDPKMISDLIAETIVEYRDEDLYQATLTRERNEKHHLRAVSNRWDEVKAFLDEE